MTVLKISDKTGDKFAAANYLYQFWTKYNLNFKTVKRAVFEDETFEGTSLSFFWSEGELLELFSEWNDTFSSVTDTEELKKLYKILKGSFLDVIEKHFYICIGEERLGKTFAKLFSNIARFLLSADEDVCLANEYQDIDFYDNLVCLIFNFFDVEDDGVNEDLMYLNPLILEEFQEGEVIDLILTNHKYVSFSEETFSFKEPVFFEGAMRLADKRNVKFNIILKDIETFITYRDEDRFAGVEVFNAVFVQWKYNKDNISVTVSEDDYKLLKHYQNNPEEANFEYDFEIDHISEILEAIDNSKNI